MGEIGALFLSVFSKLTASLKMGSLSLNLLPTLKMKKVGRNPADEKSTTYVVGNLEKHQDSHRRWKYTNVSQPKDV